MQIDNNEILITGKLVKIIQFKEDWDIDIEDPELIIKKIENNGFNCYNSCATTLVKNTSL